MGRFVNTRYAQRRRKFGIGGGRYSVLRKKYINAAVNTLATVHVKSQGYTSSIPDENVPTKLTLKQVKYPPLEGYRLFNLELLASHFGIVCLHSALCENGRKLAVNGDLPITIITESKPRGLSAVLIAQCHGCGKLFYLDGSPKVPAGDGTHRMDVNVRAVWATMATGGGATRLNELFSTLNCPGINCTTFTEIELQIGKWWHNYSNEELLAAGREERELAIARNDYHVHEGEKVPAITVICDGGWSKRTHKHSYNALGGVAIIIGAETKKILHIGVRNKYCHMCVKARGRQCEPPAHECFANWSQSSQSMEADIIVEGFLQAEQKHGVRYMRVIGDGDSSVYANIIDQVPVWGPDVRKLECANHACKCPRSSLEKLVADKPRYKGAGKLTKAVRMRLVTAARCAIRLRSCELDRNTGKELLRHDIKNSIFHIFGKHDRCTDFCKVKTGATGVTRNLRSSSKISTLKKAKQDHVGVVMSSTSNFWNEGMNEVDEEQSRGDFFFQGIDLDSAMLADAAVLLERLASKADRLLGNFTTNLAECWMSLRCKFDGGKFYNRCQKGSWHARCFGASIRQSLGVSWSPKVWECVTKTPAGQAFEKHYNVVSRINIATEKYYSKPDAKLKRRKRKLTAAAQSSSKKAKKAYGPDALDITPDVTISDLQVLKDEYYKAQISVTSAQISMIEERTKLQSSSEMWHQERCKRLTASHFGEIVSRSPAIKITPLIKRLLHCKFKGNQSTKFGLSQEAVSIKEYLTSKQIDKLKVIPKGLVISHKFNFLAASTDGQVLDCNGKPIGLLEIKNVLHNKAQNLYEAAKKSSFCLKVSNDSLTLRQNHKYYFQCQGQLNILEMPWLDFVVRTVNPYQLHIERIYRDVSLWESQMVPKLEAFFFKCVLPELACPRYDKSPGIREPGLWFEDRRAAATSRKCKAGTNRQPTTTASHSVTARTSTRLRKQKFVGRQISHKWIVDEEKGLAEWYTGNVLSVNGVDGEAGAVYQVSYDSDTYDVEHLQEDLEAGSLKFLDLS